MADRASLAGDDENDIHSATSDRDLIGRIWGENQHLSRTLRELQRMIDAHSVMSITDRRGVILEANSKFVELSKYSLEELIGAPQSIISAGTHSREFFAKLWHEIGQGEVWQGEICNRAKDGTLYWVDTTIIALVDEAGVPERYMSIGNNVSQLRQTERRVRKLAFFDPLTKLPNRSAIVKHLDESVNRPGDDFRAVLTVAFEELSLVNDAFGYEMGNRMLRVIGAALTGFIEDRNGLPKTPATVGRVTSDGFALCFNGLGENREEAIELIEGMAVPFSQALKAVIVENLGKLADVSLRIGYVLYQSSEQLDGETIYNRAQMAWRRAEPSRSVPTPCRFEEQMIIETNDRVNQVFDLHRGIVNEELVLHLQPVVNARREQIGYEALVRWQDPTRGIVGPEDFIPLAERTGLIIDIGAWVLDQTCRVLKELSQIEPAKDHLVSVNVSELQLHQADFVDTVLEALQRHGVKPQYLKLEITESMMHTNAESTNRKLNRLRDEHIEIAIDDFGEGYSSISALRRLPVQILKIDRSIIMNVVDDPIDAALVSTVAAMAHVLGLVVVAEGVETEAQFQKLREFDIEFFQGFLFGRPAPISESLRKATRETSTTG